MEAVSTHPVVVLEAPPGSGKTCAVPPALLDRFPGQVVVLEPRRLAARWAARRVAQLRDQELGGEVGYQVRFDDRTGPQTRLVYATHGILLRRMLSDPQLSEVSVLVLDEFHERQLEGDLVLALARRLLPRLRLVVMSATLDGEALAQKLGGVRIECPGAPHPLEIAYTGEDARPLEERVKEAVRANQSRGDQLVFLPGAAEIRRCQQALEGFPREVRVLHGDLDPAAQDQALTPGDRPRVILSTNLAESSLTVEGVDTVIDSGLARVMSHSPWTGLPRLQLERISRSSALQRAGRAARLGPGRAVRLYSEADCWARPEADTPEILRGELSSLVLTLEALDLPALDWLDAPPPDAMAQAVALLERLGALKGGRLTGVGREMARFPLHPRLARVLTACPSEAGCKLVSLLGDRPPDGASDVTLRLKGPLDRGALQLKRMLKPGQPSQNLEQALLRGFPDRVARATKGSEEVLLCTGGTARLLGDPPHGRYLVALDVEERSEGKRIQRWLRLYSEVEEEWLLEDSYDRRQVSWNVKAQRVEAFDQLRYGELVLDETRRSAEPGPETAVLLFNEARRQHWPEKELVEGVQARARIAFPKLQTVSFEALLEKLCQTRTSLRQLREADWTGEALTGLDSSERYLLNRVAPRTVDLKGRARVPVHYPLDGPPYVASRMADFFGMAQGPSIGGRPVVMHLLAPNHRPVQITSDLAGFWERIYPKLRQELRRRYPRHPWPENPLL